MKKHFLILLLFAGMVNAQIVNIPDANFKAELVNSTAINSVAKNILGVTVPIDTNTDGEIQVSEAEAIYSLRIYMANVVDLTGISSFVNLTNLECDSNSIAALDLSALTHLKNFSCNENQITNINTMGLPAGLEVLSFYDNQVTALDVSGIPNLKSLNCSTNQITTLEVHGLHDLEYFYCYTNQLTSLNMSGLDSMINLQCQSNQLSTLDVSSMTHLTSLGCYNNQLLYMFVKNGSADLNASFANNLNLQFICADESQIPLLQLYADQYNMDNVVINSYCSFTPGGNYNTITGNIKYDADNNGCDAGDMTLANVRVNINDGNVSMASFIHASGQYTAYTQSGNFDIVPSIENPQWFTFSPSGAVASFPDNDNNIATQDFCITANEAHPDVEVVIAPIHPARPGFDAVYNIVYRNKGNQTLSGNITFTYNDEVLDYLQATTTPDAQNTGLLNWNYSNLRPFENRSFNITLNVNSPLESPAVNVGDILLFEATITPVVSDDIPADNLYAYRQTVVGSFDPNNITCLEGDVVPPSEIGNYLHYVINFENTGTFPAENVVVKTEVDAANFDIGSLQLMNANFPVDARITGNKVEFIFKNIQLPIGGHGHILLKIKTNNTLVTGDAVAKRADIFFDYNAPVDTGFANTVFQTLSNSEFDIDDSIVVAPNPAGNEVIVKASNNIKSIQLYDVQGRVISTSIVDELESKLDISSHSKGIFFIKIITEKGIQVQKLLKD